MHPLKLPEFDYQVEGNNIFCQVRKKWVVLTPEEWVRQHFINLLVAHLNYPKGLFKLEHSMRYFKNQKRSDISVLDKGGEMFLLVECKAPNVKLDQKVVNQVSAYNKVLDSQYLAITNGMTHFIWKKEELGFKQIKEFPFYQS
ncbi:Type I restriction enzyme R protein N terminus (HSDR_N) [Ekhidna lutea]|uniref:Type I restriction enzyme R protein N terminus (HSDR_N) n=1 Tax=Ekhidna lutea TaxID=447679 RepID=A0A239K4W2_EKHLU|nr:type I restriction enzyme HsdR N-terminal domain-containing protein [Ekhidna lutea]SNT12990.1 Type I restriction enzyme R protein N terminus (HSDR_N) [Ekhidna lutea]